MAACREHYGATPVALLAERGLLGKHWVLVHGTHTTAAELEQIAGRRVNLAEVESRLRGLQAVRDVWVGVRPGPDPVIGAAPAATWSEAESSADDSSNAFNSFSS